MANKSKANGTASESAVRDLAERFCFIAERRALRGASDEGDVWVDHGHLVIQVKSETSKGNKWFPPWSKVDEWFRQAQIQSQRATRCDAAVLVVKKNGYGAGRSGNWYAWITASDFAYISAPSEEIAALADHQSKQRIMMPLGDLFAAYDKGRRRWIPGGAS